MPDSFTAIVQVQRNHSDGHLYVKRATNFGDPRAPKATSIQTKMAEIGFAIQGYICTDAEAAFLHGIMPTQ